MDSSSTSRESVALGGISPRPCKRRTMKRGERARQTGTLLDGQQLDVQRKSHDGWDLAPALWTGTTTRTVSSEAMQTATLLDWAAAPVWSCCHAIPQGQPRQRGTHYRSWQQLHSPRRQHAASRKKRQKACQQHSSKQPNAADRGSPSPHTPGWAAPAACGGRPPACRARPGQGLECQRRRARAWRPHRSQRAGRRSRPCPACMRAADAQVQQGWFG